MIMKNCNSEIGAKPGQEVESEVEETNRTVDTTMKTTSVQLMYASFLYERRRKNKKVPRAPPLQFNRSICGLTNKTTSYKPNQTEASQIQEHNSSDNSRELKKLYKCLRIPP
ncbi:hypothetical protein P8452_67761 [Trifolium repens]|jgi:hypothetical protein|nr:hypothetical protein P8452_67761 [Trifolium repens]